MLRHVDDYIRLLWRTLKWGYPVDEDWRNVGILVPEYVTETDKSNPALRL